MRSRLLPVARTYRFAALRGQFIASHRPQATLRPEWRVDVIGGWHLYRYSTTRMVHLLVAGEPVGWMTGAPPGPCNHFPQHSAGGGQSRQETGAGLVSG
jgi:hypothetical protein